MELFGLCAEYLIEFTLDAYFHMLTVLFLGWLVMGIIIFYFARKDD